MDFQKEAKNIGDVIGVTDETAIKYLANNLEIAYIKGKMSSVREFDKMGEKMTLEGNIDEYTKLHSGQIKSTKRAI